MSGYVAKQSPCNRDRVSPLINKAKLNYDVIDFYLQIIYKQNIFQVTL